MKRRYSKYTTYKEHKELNSRYTEVELPKLSSNEFITVDELRVKLRKNVGSYYNKHIVFRERDTANNVYSIEFTLQSVVFVDDNHAQFAGFITMGGNRKRTNDIIEYWFNVGKFYRIVNKRKKKELEINPLWNDMSFIKVFMKSLTTKT